MEFMYYVIQRDGEIFIKIEWGDQVMEVTLEDIINVYLEANIIVH